jgi:hypothetical protein
MHKHIMRGYDECHGTRNQKENYAKKKDVATEPANGSPPRFSLEEHKYEHQHDRKEQNLRQDGNQNYDEIVGRA